MIKIKGKIKKLITKRKIFTFILVVFGILCIFVPKLFIESNENATDSSLEILYYLSQIVSLIFVMTSVVIAGWQYYLSSRAEIQNLEVEQVQRAIELSEFYKENVLKPYNAIYYVYDKSGIRTIIDDISQRDMQKFDTVEMRKLIKEKDIEYIKSLETSEKFIKAVLEANAIYNLRLHMLRTTKEIETKNEKIMGITIETNSLLSSFLSGIVTNMLNDLEYFAMHFSHKTADETVVFQSLHQTYLQIVKYMYYNIAKLNEPMKGKYYTNIIELHNIWYARSEKHKEQMYNNSEHITDPGTVIEKKK